MHARPRARLLTVDAHILRDIGVTRADVLEMLRNSAD